MEVSEFNRTLIKLLVRSREIQNSQNLNDNPRKTIQLNRDARAAFSDLRKDPTLMAFIYNHFLEIANAVSVFQFKLIEKEDESFTIIDTATGSTLCSISTAGSGNFNFYAYAVFKD